MKAAKLAGQRAALAAFGLEKQALVGWDDLLGAGIGYNFGQQQAARGEDYSFGLPQVGSLLLPGGMGYQIGRAIGHPGQQTAKPAAKSEKKEKSPKAEKPKSEEKKAGQTCTCGMKHCAICSLDKMKAKG